MDLHRGAEKSLQERIVQFLRDAGSFREPLLKAGMEATGELMEAEPV
jgi:hypothetical protein